MLSCFFFHFCFRLSTRVVRVDRLVKSIGLCKLWVSACSVNTMVWYFIWCRIYLAHMCSCPQSTWLVHCLLDINSLLSLNYMVNWPYYCWCTSEITISVEAHVEGYYQSMCFDKWLWSYSLHFWSSMSLDPATSDSCFWTVVHYPSSRSQDAW